MIPEKSPMDKRISVQDRTLGYFRDPELCLYLILQLLGWIFIASIINQIYKDIKQVQVNNYKAFICYLV